MSEIQHYGVKGMHWGVRKKKDMPAHSDYGRSSRAYDRRQLGKRSVRRINENMHKGMSLTEARAAEQRRKRNRDLKMTGLSMFMYIGFRTSLFKTAYETLRDTATIGKAAYAHAAMAREGAKAAANLLADTRGIGNHKIVDIGDNFSWS